MWCCRALACEVMAKPSIFSPPPQGFPHARNRSEREREHEGCSRAPDAPGSPRETIALRHAPEFAHLAKLRDLEAYVQHHVQALQASPLPPGLLPPCSNCCRRCRTSMRYLCHRNRSAYGRLSRCWPRCEPRLPRPSHPLPLRQYRLRSRRQRTLLCRRVKTRVILAPSLCSSCVALVPDARRCSPKCHSTRYTISCGAPLRYEDRRQLTPLGLLRWGKRETFVAL